MAHAYRLVPAYFVFTERRFVLVLVDKQGCPAAMSGAPPFHRSITHFNEEIAGTFDLEKGIQDKI